MKMYSNDNFEVDLDQIYLISLIFSKYSPVTGFYESMFKIYLKNGNHLLVSGESRSVDEIKEDRERLNRAWGKRREEIMVQ